MNVAVPAATLSLGSSAATPSARKHVWRTGLAPATAEVLLS
jgi:hypothetical protein